MGNPAVCPSCGLPSQRPGPCARCGYDPDPYAALDPAPRAQQPDPYLMGQPWVAPTIETATPPPVPARNNALLAVIGVLSFVVLAALGLVAFLVLRGGEAPVAAVQESLSPSATPTDPVAIPTANPTQTATVFVTRAPDPTTGGAGVEPVLELNDGDALTQAQALEGVEDYLRVTAGNPAAGWQLLTERRQGIEDEPAYYEYWARIATATVSGCSQDANGSLLCQFTSVDTAGKQATSEVRYWLTVEDGRVKVDIAGGASPEQLAAEEALEDYRQDSLYWLELDDRWVAELSAKRPGINDPLQVARNGTHVFYFPDILADHERLVDRFPGVDVLMLRREDWGKQGRDLWHTVADPGGLASQADVEAWCAKSFPELTGDALHNQCTPRQLTSPHWS